VTLPGFSPSRKASTASHLLPFVALAKEGDATRIRTPQILAFAFSELFIHGSCRDFGGASRGYQDDPPNFRTQL
jgi:hypothetical protein